MYWDESYSFTDHSVVKTPDVAYIHPAEVRSAFGWTDMFSEAPPEEATESALAKHQASVPRLPVPKLRETCELYLDSLVGILTAEEYISASSAVGKFLEPGGVGEQLQRLLEQRESTMAASNTAPSWLEPWWDDMYLYGRDPLPINVNYSFGLEAHPKGPGSPEMGQAWRASALLHAAGEIYLGIHKGTMSLDFEKGPGGTKAPLDMSQFLRVFGASRIPGNPRDTIQTYTTRRPTPADECSTTTEYVDMNPRHAVVLCRNRFFSLELLTEDGQLVPVDILHKGMRHILRVCEENPKGGPPVGLFTTMDRSAWASIRTDMVTTSPKNGVTLETIQSALLVVVLDAVTVSSRDELARVAIHGSGTNRWFDKHQLIVTKDGSVAVCLEHSVGDGTTTLSVFDDMWKRHSKMTCAATLDTPTTSPDKDGSRQADRPTAVLRELHWQMTGALDTAMRDAFEVFRASVKATRTSVLNFTTFGGNWIKQAKMSPDAFLQVAFQLTYYKMYGRNDATYESASTRSFLHGRTETVRSVTSVVSDFCHAVTTQPLFPQHARTTVPKPVELLRRAVDAHVTYMRRAKAAMGVDRHLLGLRLICQENSIELPDIFTDPSFTRSSKWRLSTSHCGSNSLQLFGFGPVVPDGYGVGYMIKNDSVSVTITCNASHPQGSSELFGRMLESTLLHLTALVDADRIREEGVASPLTGAPERFVHPTAAMSEFDFEPGVGFRYRTHTIASLYRSSMPVGTGSFVTLS
eukprot:PhM_4_TR14425/c0_g1_i1/m.24278/K00624/E2.3.1.7; carnitine O-acetyltransferase